MGAVTVDNVEHVESRSLLTKANGYLGGFTHSLNPYMGCAWGENGCGVYCYVADSPIGIHAGRTWGQWVKAKSNAAEANSGRLLRSPPGYTMADHVGDVARTVLFLASDDCPTATAADFVVDGGLTAGYRQPGIPGGD